MTSTSSLRAGDRCHSEEVKPFLITDNTQTCECGGSLAQDDSPSNEWIDMHKCFVCHNNTSYTAKGTLAYLEF